MSGATVHPHCHERICGAISLLSGSLRAPLCLMGIGGARATSSYLVPFLAGALGATFRAGALAFTGGGPINTRKSSESKGK